MKLTRLQFKILRVWLRYHACGYGIGQWMLTCWKSWLLLGAMGAWSCCFVAPLSPAAGWGLFGLCLGAFLRDVGYYQVSRRTWPITDLVFDWKRVQELVSAYGKDAP